MYIQRSVQSGELTLRNSLKRQESFNYDYSDSSSTLPDLSKPQKSPGNDNGVALGIVRFCIVLGGILFIIVITGIVTYIYRRKLLKLKSRPKKPPKTNTISYILDYYEHDYIEPEKNNNITMRINKSNISEPTLNGDVQPLPITTSQISAPMPNSSVSIFNKERANSLASNLATRSVDATTISPPVPAARTSANDKKLKTISRESEMETISNTSLDNINIIPEMFGNSTENTAAPIDISTKWFTYPIDSPTIPLTPSIIPKTFSGNSRPSSEESDSITVIPEVIRKSKRDLRIRIDTFDQFKLAKDKTTHTSVGTSTHDNNLGSESKEYKDKDENNHEYRNKSVKADLSKTTHDERSTSLGAPIKNNQHKRNGNIFEYRLIRSKTIT